MKEFQKNFKFRLIWNQKKAQCKIAWKKQTANLEDFLASLGLVKHKESFEEQEVDLNMMIELDEEDVKEWLKAVNVHRYGERYMIIQKKRYEGCK